MRPAILSSSLVVGSNFASLFLFSFPVPNQCDLPFLYFWKESDLPFPSRVAPFATIVILPWTHDCTPLTVLFISQKL